MKDMDKKDLVEAFSIWEPLAKRPEPPADNEQSELHFWLRDASPEDLWRAIRSVYLRGKEEVPY